MNALDLCPVCCDNPCMCSLGADLPDSWATTGEGPVAVGVAAAAPLALDLFSGARGWSVGAHQLGIVDHGVEIMKEARLTSAAAGFVTIHDDVWSLPADRLPHYDGLIASPPCQTFSAAGKGSGRKALDQVLRLVPHVPNWSRSRLRKVGGRATGDDRTALVLSPLWYALNMPGIRWIAFEQVPTVLPVWEACADVLKAHGWNTWTGTLQAEQYGVPQTRKRAFLIASRNHEVGAPEPTHSRYYSRDPGRLDLGVLKWVSMAEALGWGLAARPSPTVTGGGTETGGAEPIAKLARYTGRPDWTDRPAAVVAAGITGEGRPRSLAGDRGRRVVKGTAYWLNDVNDYPGPTPAIEGETPAWIGTNGKQFLQAGNAVPPLLAAAVLEVAMYGAAARAERVAGWLAALEEAAS